MPTPAQPAAEKRRDSKLTPYKVLLPLLLVLLMTGVPGGLRLPVALFFLVSLGWLCSGPIAYCWRRAHWLLRGLALAAVIGLAGAFAGGLYQSYQVHQLAEAMKEKGASAVWVEGGLYHAHVSTIFLAANAGDAALAEIVRMEGAETVTRLDLDRSRVTDGGLAHLANLPSLEWLSIANTRITDAGLTHLARVPSLRTLDIGELRLTAEGAQYLQSVPLEKLFCRASDRLQPFLNELHDAHPQMSVIRIRD